MAAISGTAILLCSVPLTILYGGIVYIKSPEKWRTVFPLLVISVFTIAYNYNPINEPDLVRYFSAIEKAGSMRLVDYISYTGSGLYVQDFAFWLAGTLGLPHLVPGISTAIVYGIAIYISCDYAERTYQQDMLPLVLMYQVCCLPFISICNNVRNICAFAIILLAVYRDILQKKRNIWTAALYIIPVFMHKSGFILLLVRVILALSGRYFVATAIFTFLIPTILNVLINYRMQIMRFGILGRIVANTIYTAYNSLTSTSDWAITVMTSKFHLTNRYMAFAVCLFLLFQVLVRHPSMRKNTFTMYVVYLCILTIACYVFRTPVYWRFFAAVNISGGVILLPCFKSFFEGKRAGGIIEILVFAGVAATLLSLQLYGSRSEVNWLELISDTLIHPFTVILMKMFSAIMAL